MKLLSEQPSEHLFVDCSVQYEGSFMFVQNMNLPLANLDGFGLQIHLLMSQWSAHVNSLNSRHQSHQSICTEAG